MSESLTLASGKFAAWNNAAAGQDARGVAITGASGWIGRAMTAAVLAATPAGHTPIVRLFGSAHRAMEIGGRPLSVEILGAGPPLDPQVEWLVVHLSVAGADRETDPERLRALNDAMLRQAFALAEGEAVVRRFVAASSGAVHQLGHGASEKGSPGKQAYARLKADHEQMAREWARRTGTPLLIPRIFNVGGPYMNHADRYALGSFVTQALDTGAIEIAATRPVIRSYVHVLELARVLLELSASDDPDILLETRGTAAVEMGELADAVAQALGKPLQIRRPPMTSDDEDRYLGDGTLYQATLTRMGSEPVALGKIIRDTAGWLRPGHIRL